jgi:hypothetical protein
MSLGLLFFMLIIKAINFPIYCGADWIFVGWKYLLTHNIPTIVFLLCFIGSIICRKRFLNSLKGNQDRPCSIKTLKNANYEYLTFLTTYIIPLICFDPNNPKDCLLLGILLILLGLLFIKTNLYYLNPSLAIIGFNIYLAEIQYKDSIINDVIIISKTKLKENDVFFKHDIEGISIVYGTKK